MFRFLWIATAAVVVAGCGTDEGLPRFEGEVGGEGHRALERHERFVGLWLVAQPTHATYEATYYDFREDGLLYAHRSIDLGGHLQKHGVTGSVAQESSGISCVFGQRWYSLDPQTLVIAGDCSDARRREITLGFPSSEDDLGLVVEIIAVGGENDWIHDNWDWMFKKCPPQTDPDLHDDCIEG